jgi:nicotinamidase-related amidase
MSALAEVARSRLLLVDLQARLAPHVADGDEVVRQCQNLLDGARILGVPVLASEHYPEGLGPTVPSLRQHLADGEVLRKDHFSCIAEPALRPRLLGDHRRTLVVAGMEAHVCVMQSALEAAAQGLRVLLVADAVGSRRAADREFALRRMAGAGISLVSREMILFEWCRQGGTATFRELHRRCLR